ncbi:hypothetical protein OHB12_28095 [Nocardia sp. NBC_01730]|uniref:hypothetical protein n=1 Tax=Nocardia sp. NBC_01730 TaxID=2975998 RepID=UPI002E155D74|nr:hypothetical protein OHB12_28095 [Nocardia sp. NBC_01730]
MITVNAFVVVETSDWNDRGRLDVFDFTMDTLPVASFPAEGDLRVVLALTSKPYEYSTVSFRMAEIRPGGGSGGLVHELTSEWPGPADGREFSTLRLTYSLPFTIHRPGTHGLALFLDGEDTERAKTLFEVSGPLG